MYRVFKEKIDPFTPAHPVPEDDEELYRQVEEFLAPYAASIREKPLFIMNLRPNDRVIQAFRNCSHKLLTQD